ncbi:WYL domain-containing protein [Shewanella xiamenensis]|uniref:WYL domain-containing protein n=1 Tax=Shewanella xiamenensis TaxID=332186 RepID=UPI00217DFD36|nr:WYL domain-containing protein [Shewanella xiamenensis]MCT8857505.1 WYL domain-containing protein [Shewanella xiamenensis]UWG66477.1 WYL domain-containing protein [Shewanella xiamenensis]
MTQLTLESLTLAQRERLAHIDFVLMFKGEARRTDLVERFNIAPSVATQDFARYKEIAPQNVVYDEKRKQHLKAASFISLFDFDVIRTLATLSQGFGDGFLRQGFPTITCESPYRLNRPAIQIVAAISEVIYKASSLKITYHSLSSGKSVREIVPHTLVDTGLRWHVRAYDRTSNEFRDFVLSRIESAKLHSHEPKEHEQQAKDKQWNRIVELELIPHPSINHKEAIERDYRMEQGALKIDIRAALAGYLLRLWNVDCSQAHTLTGPELHLALKNHQALYGVENLVLAPGMNNNSGTFL